VRLVIRAGSSASGSFDRGHQAPSSVLRRDGAGSRSSRNSGGCTTGAFVGLRLLLGGVMELDPSLAPTGTGAVRTPRTTPTWRSTCEVSSVVGSYVTRVAAARSRPICTIAMIIGSMSSSGRRTCREARWPVAAQKPRRLAGPGAHRGRASAGGPALAVSAPGRAGAQAERTGQAAAATAVDGRESSWPCSFRPVRRSA